MSNREIILQILCNVNANSPYPTGNTWYISLPASFQETIDKEFNHRLQDDGSYHMAGNIIMFSCNDYKS